MVGHHKGGGLLRFGGLLYAALDANPMNQFFSLKFIVETRLSSESLELLIGFLAHLETKLCHKNKKWSKFLPHTNSNLG